MVGTSMKRRLSLSMPYGDAILDKAEASLVERALTHLRRTCAPDAASLAAQLERLELLGTALEQAPSLISSSTLGGSTRDERTLVEQLSHMDPLGGELALPEKAVVAHAYLMAKISLLRAFVVALGPRAPGAEDALCRGFRDELAQSVYTAIATEILIGVLCDDYLPERTRTRAARQLVLIWERAALVEVDDFCPMLESAWQARNHLTAGFGALLGTAEYLRLVQQNCSAQFLEFFTREAVSVSETQAFQEFLFGLPFEDLRAAARRDGGRARVRDRLQLRDPDPAAAHGRGVEHRQPRVAVSLVPAPPHGRGISPHHQESGPAAGRGGLPHGVRARHGLAARHRPVRGGSPRPQLIAAGRA